MGNGDAFGDSIGEPDYDSAAQAAMVMATAIESMRHAHEMQRIAEKYYRDKTAELAVASPVSSREAGTAE